MKSFSFNLHKVLSYRETVEDVLLAELAAIRSAYEDELARLMDITTMRDTFHDTMKRDLTCGDPEHIRRAYHYLQDLSRQVVAQEVAVSQLASRKESKTAEVMKASADRKALEKLREHKADEHRREMLGEEQKSLDDTAGVRHRRRSDASHRRAA